MSSKQKKRCQEDHRVLNPMTNRCINVQGKTFQKLYKEKGMSISWREEDKKKLLGNQESEKWIFPDDDNLAHEYKVEIQLKNWGKDIFKSKHDFIKAVKEKGKIVNLTPESNSKIVYRSRTKNKEQLLELIKTYKSYPQFRNEKTLNNLYNRIFQGEPVNMPIILKNKNGIHRVLSGNTRLDIAFQLNVTPKVIILDTSKIK